MKHKIRDKSMFASYTYKTIKYMGCDPDYIKCTLSSHEKEIIIDHKFKPPSSELQYTWWNGLYVAILQKQ